MPNIFDDLAKTVFDKAAQVMGYDATWAPSSGGSAVSARVLYKDPSEVRRMGTEDGGYNSVDFLNPMYMMEWKQADFVGLYEAVRSGLPERVSIEGKEYLIRHVKAAHDGKCYYGMMEPVEGLQEGEDNQTASPNGVNPLGLGGNSVLDVI